MVGASRSMSNAELAELIDILTKLPRAKRRLRMGQNRITALARQLRLLTAIIKVSDCTWGQGVRAGHENTQGISINYTWWKSCDGCHPPKDSTVYIYNVLNPIDNTNEVPGGVEPQLLVNQPGGVVDCEVSRDWRFQARFQPPQYLAQARGTSADRS